MASARRARDVVVFTGGEDLDPHGLSLPDSAVVIAADSGLHGAFRLGVEVDHVVGDLDSVESSALERARDEGADVDVHPVDKDRTDLEIAMDLAIAHSPEHIVVVGGHGGRLDHFAGLLMLLASSHYRSAHVVAHVGPATVTVVHDSAALRDRPGAFLSLVAVHGTARGVSTAGLRFPLDGEDLAAGSTRGVSNEFVQPNASVWLDSGSLLAIQPGEQPSDTFEESELM